jgi:penicillin-binding protein 1A
MSNPDTPLPPKLTAGEPLVAPRPTGRTDGGRKPKGEKQRGSKHRHSASAFGWLGRLVGLTLGLLTVLGIAGGVVGYAAYRHYSADLPDVDGLKNYKPPVMSRIYAGNSRLIAELATERRIFVPYAAIPNMVKDAFISAEDQNFWTHPGIDPLAIIRAAFTDLQQMGQGRRPIGASTITQQVAKIMLLNNQVSLSRKIREALLAIRIDHALTKQRILELYLNEIYLGAQAYGVAAAAQAYFDKPLDQLTLGEAAFLGALPKAPNNYNPFRFPEAAKIRRDWVLDRMADNGYITRAQAEAAKATPIIPTAFRRPDMVPYSDWFAEDVRRQLVERFGTDVTTQGGLIVRTSLNPALQQAAEASLRNGLMAYDRKDGGWRGPVGHLDGTEQALAADWTKRLPDVTRPPGMLSSWVLAVVLSTTDSTARVGWLETDPNDPRAPSTPRTGTITLAQSTWARPVHDGRLGATPRRMSEIVQAGDVIMAEPEAPAPAAPASAPAKGGHAAAAKTASTGGTTLLLRQIPKVQGALVSLDPATGRVLAMVGGWSFGASQFNRATQAWRQPGSSFKPMVYLTALEQGITPTQRFLDAPFVVDLGAAGKWRPGNYEPTFNGPTPLYQALEQSLNLVTIRVADKVGMQAVANNAIAFHVVDNMPLVLPAALGAVDTTVIRMAGAYASLAEGGREVTPTLIDSVQDQNGQVIWKPQGLGCANCNDPSQPPQLTDDRKQIADPDSVFQLVTMMEGVVLRGTGVRAGQGMNRQIAGKTGTTSDFADAWFVGFTPDLVTAVWVGYDQPANLGENETGGNISAPIWHDFMSSALKNRPALKFPEPPGVTLVHLGNAVEAFKTGTEPGAPGAASGVIDGSAADASASPDSSGAPAPRTTGVDSGMGGLY